MKRKLQLSLVDSKYNDSYPFNRNDRQTNLFVTEVLSESSKLLGSAPLPPPPLPPLPWLLLSRVEYVYITTKLYCIF